MWEFINRSKYRRCISSVPQLNRNSIECYQWTVNVLSNYPRWMFKKNLMEFFVGLQPYLYYYYSGCTLESHDHMLSRMFYNHLTLSHDLTYWVPTLFIFLLHCMLWGFGLSVQMCGKPFPVWGSHNIEFFSSTQTRSSSKTSQSKSLHQNLISTSWTLFILDLAHSYSHINQPLASGYYNH